MLKTPAIPVMHFLERLRETGGLKSTDIANFTVVSTATVSRWQLGQKSPHPKTQRLLSDLSYISLRLGPNYSREEIRTWPYAMHPQLDGERAIDVIHDQSTEEVIALLDRLDADVYI